MTKQVYALVKYPDRDVTVTYVDNELKALQEKVGGKIETVTVSEDLVFICDEESYIKKAKFNFSFGDTQFFGTVLLLGIKGDEFTDCPLTVSDARKFFPCLFFDEGVC